MGSGLDQMIAPVVSVVIAWAAARIGEGERRGPREPGNTEILHMTYVAVDSDVAAARARPSGTAARDRKEVIGRISDGDMVDALTIPGTEEDCRAGLEALLAAGVNHIVLAPVAADETDAIGCLRRIANAVLPHIRP